MAMRKRRNPRRGFPAKGPAHAENRPALAGLVLGGEAAPSGSHFSSTPSEPQTADFSKSPASAPVPGSIPIDPDAILKQRGIVEILSEAIAV